jgi:hypothetical protein
MPLRSVTRIIDSVSTLEGGGFPVRRPFPVVGLSHIDPFLLLDHLGPVNWAPRQAIGAPDHPHRGFETVTYLLEGAMQHKDSAGHRGKLTPGDVQWMTAGAGVVHSEMPESAFYERGGVMHGFQIWVNLPARDKMIPPRYQEIPSAQIPEWVGADGAATVRVIAGEHDGKRAVIATRTPIMLMHSKLNAGASVAIDVPPNLRAMCYVIDGAFAFGANRLQAAEGQLALFEMEGAVSAEAASAGQFLLLAGQPLDEPVARYGPFVMNTQSEIKQAITDYNEGRLGKIAV